MLVLMVAATGLAGLPLLLHYEPDPATAHASVRRLTQGIWGWLRSFHAWAAAAVLVLALVHPLAAWMQGTRSLPRKRVWVTGALLLGVLMVTYLSGTILRFDHRGWEALEHLEQGLNLIGISMIEDQDPETARLGLFYVFHVILVPLLLVGLGIMHIARTGPGGRLLRRLVTFMRLALRPALGLAALVALLSVLFPPRFGPAPIAGLETTNPPWPFLWLVPLQDLAGAWGLLALPLLLALLAVVPWFSHQWSRRVRAIIALALGLVLLILTLMGVSG
jgi:quinol-cytochrome oxidoreductase complex cytochrome b subunit